MYLEKILYFQISQITDGTKTQIYADWRAVLKRQEILISNEYNENEGNDKESESD